jgi:hypothetical protein
MKLCPKTRQQLADEYGVNIRTFLSWCKHNNIHLPKGLLCPNKVEEIYSRIGEPAEKTR